MDNFRATVILQSAGEAYRYDSHLRHQSWLHTNDTSRDNITFTYISGDTYRTNNHYATSHREPNGGRLSGTTDRQQPARPLIYAEVKIKSLVMRAPYGPKLSRFSLFCAFNISIAWADWRITVIS